MISFDKGFIDATKSDLTVMEKLANYTLKKKHTEYPLKVRVDEYTDPSDPNKPTKYVTKFILDAKKGKVEAPTIEALMDSLDQQQLSYSYDNTKSGPRLKIKKSIYMNDKIRELQKLEDRINKKETLDTKDTDRLKTLTNILVQAASVKPPKSPNAPAENLGERIARLSQTNTRSFSNKNPLPPPPPGDTTAGGKRTRRNRRNRRNKTNKR